MATTVNLQITLESLVEAIGTLNIEQKRQLLEILEQQIFEAEEESYEGQHPALKLAGLHASPLVS